MYAIALDGPVARNTWYVKLCAQAGCVFLILLLKKGLYIVVY